MYAETKTDTEVVGFKQTTAADPNMVSANRAASGVAVPATDAAYGTAVVSFLRQLLPEQ